MQSASKKQKTLGGTIARNAVLPRGSSSSSIDSVMSESEQSSQQSPSRIANVAEIAALACLIRDLRDEVRELKTQNDKLLRSNDELREDVRNLGIRFKILEKEVKQGCAVEFASSRTKKKQRGPDLSVNVIQRFSRHSRSLTWHYHVGTTAIRPRLP